jgi:predicted nucleic acid-binding Zn ribbon protein
MGASISPTGWPISPRERRCRDRACQPGLQRIVPAGGALGLPLLRIDLRDEVDRRLAGVLADERVLLRGVVGHSC